MSYKNKNFLLLIILSILFEINLLISTLIFRNHQSNLIIGLWFLSNYVTFFACLILPQEKLLFSKNNTLQRKTRYARGILFLVLDLFLLFSVFLLIPIQSLVLITPLLILNSLSFISYFVLSYLLLFKHNSIDEALTQKLIQEQKAIANFDIYAFFFSYFLNKKQKTKFPKICIACSFSGFVYVFYFLTLLVITAFGSNTISIILSIIFAVVTLILNNFKLFNYSPNGIITITSENSFMIVSFFILFLTSIIDPNSINFIVIIVYVLLLIPTLKTQQKMYQDFKIQFDNYNSNAF